MRRASLIALLTILLAWPFAASHAQQRGMTSSQLHGMAGTAVRDTGIAIVERRATTADLARPRPWARVAVGGAAAWFRASGKARELSLVVDGTSITLASQVLDRGAMSSTASLPLEASVVHGNAVAARTTRLTPTGIGTVPFGLRKGHAVASLRALFGTPTWHGENTGCGRRFTEVEWGDLVAEFRVNRFSGYRYLEGGWLTTSGSPRASRRNMVPRLETARHITLGSTLAQLRRAYPRLHAGGTDMWKAGNGLVFMDNAAHDPEPDPSRIIEIKIGTCGDF